MIKGRLGARAVNGTIEVFFMQRESPDGGANHPVTVYRRQADDINFSSGLCGDMPGNWVEYIDNQKIDDARVSVVFDGRLPFENSFSTYYDCDVEVGHTYLYWVVQKVDDSAITIGPVACKLRDPNVWWSYEKTIAEMKKLCSQYPQHVSMKCYGESTQHREIWGLRIGNGNNPILLAGAVHASEPGPELIINALSFILETHMDLLERVGVCVLPTVNVDVRESTVLGEPFYLRKNPNGVDLNRNFNWQWKEEFVYGYSNADPRATTYHGPYAESENETKAAVRFVEENSPPSAIFVYDSSSVITEDWLLFASTPGEDCWERDNKIANVYSQNFRKSHPECGTFTAPPMHYPKEQMECFSGTGQPHGTFEGWVHFRYGVPAYSVQAAGSKEAIGHNNDDVSYDLLLRWARRHAYALIAVLEKIAEGKADLQR